MKKLILTLAGVLILLTAASAESRIFLSLGANLISPADAAYKDIYGNHVLYPEGALSIRTIGGLCVTGSYGEFARKGLTPDLGLATKSKQGYFTAGLSYLQRVASFLCVQGGAGVASISFREEALDTVVTGSKMGFMAEAGAYLMPEAQNFFLGLKVGYLSANVSDVSTEIAGVQPVKLGGLKVCVCVGIQLFGSH